MRRASLRHHAVSKLTAHVHTVRSEMRRCGCVLEWSKQAHLPAALALALALLALALLPPAP